jgi:hypothetical protein
MKATETCSCGGRFEAEGRGATAALREWRRDHQHIAPVRTSPWDIIGPQVPHSPYPAWPVNPITWQTPGFTVSSGSSSETPPALALVG